MFKFNFSDLDLEDGNSLEKDTRAQRISTLGTLDTCLSKRSLETETHSSGTANDNVGDSEIDESNNGISHTARELSKGELAQSLPPAFSYSPLIVLLDETAIPPTCFNAKSFDDDDVQKCCVTSRTVSLLHRDLFDARYQLVSEGDEANSDAARPHSSSSSKGRSKDLVAATALQFFDNPTDLVPGIYEGGLKTWECALDLVGYLSGVISDSDEGAEWIRGKRVLEIGCGTAVPTVFLLRVLFSHPRKRRSNSEDPWTVFVLQDYNDIVLKLVTFPNVLVQWYASPLADAYRSIHPAEDDETFIPDAPGDLLITPDLLDAFYTSLQEQHVSAHFISGSWQSLASDEALCTFPFDITLTSETIYQMSSLQSLVELIKRAGLNGEAKSADSRERDIVDRARKLSLEDGRRLCFVAAKTLYFGVGGGVMEFEKALTEAGGKLATVLERENGVGRNVMSIDWM